MLRRSRLLPKSVATNWLYRGSIGFQRRVVEMLSGGVEAFVCYDRHAFYAFQRALGKDVKLILDLSSVHPRTAKRLIEEELDLWPELRASMHVPGFTDANFDRVAEEASMANYVLAGSGFARNSCIENGVDPDSIRVVPYGTDTQRFHPLATKRRLKSRNVRFLFVGQIGQTKGIRYLLDAFVKAGLPDVELWLCGSPAGIDDVLKPLPSGCSYLGHIPNSRMPEIYNQADVLVQPSVFEGFSQVILEAMACGLPVIATTNTGCEEVMTNGMEGFIIRPRDIDALAETMIFLYENPDRRAQMGMAARKTAEQYSWDDYHRRVAQVFSDILDDSE